MSDIRNDRELTWDDEIENDTPAFILLPEGVYPFTVLGFERKRFGGSAKLPPCNQAELEVELRGDSGTATVKHSLFLHSKTEGLLCAFFTSIGQRRHGERLRMNWASVTGARGWCKVIVEDWIDREGKTRQSNRIQAFLPPEQAPVQTPPVQTSPSYAPPAQEAQKADDAAVSRWKAGRF